MSHRHKTLAGAVLGLSLAVVPASPLAGQSCLMTALPEIDEAGTAADSLALAERYLSNPPAGNIRCGTLLAGFLLGMQSSPAEDAWRDRQRASDLIEQALRDFQDEPRLYLALALVFHHRQSRTDALRSLDRALQRADRSEVPLTPRERAVVSYTRGLIHQDFWRDWRSFGQIDAVSVGQWRCSRDQAPTRQNFSGSTSDFGWLSEVNQLCPDLFAENMQNFFQPRSDMNLDARREMEAAFEAAWAEDPTLTAAPRALLAEWVYAGDWERADSLSLVLSERQPADVWTRLYRILVLHETGRDSLAEHELRSIRTALPDSIARPLEDVRPLLRTDQQPSYDALDSIGKHEVRVAFWTSLDPLYLTTWNERWLEHVSRVATAELLFSGGTLGMAGWETFAGQMWIRYGRPRHIWELQIPAGRLVFWDFGPGPDVSFERGFGYRGYRPTDASIEVANVLSRTGPQAYAMTSIVDSVLPLDAQVVRTIGEAQRPQILLYAEWPPRAAPTSRAGLTLLDLTYFPVAQWRGSKPARPGIGAELNGMAAGAYALTVEVMDTTQRRLYRLRDSVSTLRVEDPRFGVSDLLLVSEIMPPDDDEVTQRREVPVTPLYGSAIVRERALGIVWETYRFDGVTDGRRRYHVSIEILDAGRQPMLTRVLRGMRGAGEGLESRIQYESSRPMVEGRTVEWVELTSQLGIGEYRLVFRIVDRETELEVVRERDFRVR